MGAESPAVLQAAAREAEIHHCEALAAEAHARGAWLRSPSEESRAAYLVAARECGAAAIERACARLAAETALELERVAGLADLGASLRELQVTAAKIRGPE